MWLLCVPPDLILKNSTFYPWGINQSVFVIEIGFFFLLLWELSKISAIIEMNLSLQRAKWG